ncbi:hypothetical protein T4E_7848 [Trichinella pseudospiralis]|uniref:Uncharacterized protein n=1 Tax=Trichinella pseudospiralis TaxID=6337 RepID=A0A0V0XF04_TRIPS|nr:hypothetical protein T4E_7848 [Trichinella pseudospiralis]
MLQLGKIVKIESSDKLDPHAMKLELFKFFPINNLAEEEERGRDVGGFGGLDFPGSGVKRRSDVGWSVGQSVDRRPTETSSQSENRFCRRQDRSTTDDRRSRQARPTNQFASELTGRQFPGLHAHCRSGSRRTTLGKKENFPYNTLDASREYQVPKYGMSA